MLTRRHFLMSAATAAAAPAFLKAAPASERVRVGVVGVGNQGAYNWGQLAGVPSCEVVALCDVDERMTPGRPQALPQGRLLHRLPQDDRRQGARRRHVSPRPTTSTSRPRT